MKYAFYIKLSSFQETGDYNMDFVPKNKCHTDLAEKCRKALEVKFGEIPMSKVKLK